MAIQVTAKKTGWRQTDKGFVLTLLVDPSDPDWAKLATAELGTCYGIALVPIDDETGAVEKPVEVPIAEIVKPQKRFEALPRSQQAALLGNDTAFHKWIGAEYAASPLDQAKEYIKKYCKISSRKQLDTPEIDDSPCFKFERLKAQFRQAIGRETEMR